MTEKQKNTEEPIPTVTEVAQLGACERQMLFDWKDGRKRSAKLEKKAKEGIRVHKQYERAAKPQVQDKRCYIATEVFGSDAWETNSLRAFRDKWLKPSVPGRCFIALYYACSPHIVKLCRHYPTVHRCLRWILTKLVKALFTKGEDLQ